MSTALATLAGKLAERVGMDSVDPQELITTLRQTAFKGDASDAQFIALLIVANQYGLNPWTKEIYAFPDKQNGIVPVVGVDGWSLSSASAFATIISSFCERDVANV
jgi:phage recombination protein Bet